jgi:hypothetical protein
MIIFNTLDEALEADLFDKLNNDLNYFIYKEIVNQLSEEIGVVLRDELFNELIKNKYESN